MRFGKSSEQLVDPNYPQGSLFDLPRSSMYRWLITLGQKVQPIVDDIMEQIKELPYIQAD
ncbi:MAG: hypothetical protein EP298_03790 [Gammaproteobacteria bacterium]|nr:MAG: hypothetical protein EP298_03790 [Gammaproteobacteria bacterium]UTW43752.1 hypothetical protein KFE69_06595 [bacterium SCSIO 12844]